MLMNNDNDSKLTPKLNYFGTAGRIAVIIFVGFSLYLFISTVITVFLTKSSSDVTVPDVVGVPFVEVSNSIIRKGFVPDLEFRDAYDLDDGIILKQHPDPGEVVSQNSRLSLVVSRNIFRIEVPSVSNSPLPIAINKLKSINYHGRPVSLTIGVISYIPSDKVSDNMVIAQSPEAGEKVGPGRKINLLVSSGSTALDQLVPDVINQSIELCNGIILAKGFSLSQEVVQTSDRSKSGLVAWQKPSPNTSLAKGGLMQLGIYWYPLKEHPYRAYEKLEYQLPQGSEKGLYEVFVEDFKAKKTVFSSKMSSGEKIVVVFRREGNARITIVRDKNPVRVIGMDVDE